MEQRHLLTGVALGAISGPDAGGVFDIPSGKDLYVPLLGSDAGQTVSYSATTNGGDFTATVLPSSNPTLQINVSGTTAGDVAFSGAMTFSLFANIAPQTVAGIESLVEAPNSLYNGASFYRSVTSTGFQLIQGGIEMTQGKSDTTVLPDEFNTSAAFNSSGLLAMANAGPGTATSEFFVTAPNIPLDQDPLELNYGYTVFGQLLTGQNIFSDIENAPAGSQYLNNPVTITSASIISSSQAGVLQISEPSTFAGSGSITVTAAGSDGTSTTQAFNLDAIEPTTASSITGLGTGGPMVLAPVGNQTTSENTPTSAIALSATESFPGGSPTFTVTGNTAFTGAPANVTPNVTAGTSDDATVVLTPATNWVGDFDLDAHVNDSIPSDGSYPVYDALPFTLTVTGSADLEVTSTDNVGGSSVTPSTGTVVAGQPITYTVTVTNKGTTNVSGVSLVDTLPSAVSGATYTITPSSGAADLDSGGNQTLVSGLTMISDTDLSMSAGSTVTFVIKATVNSNATEGLSSTAFVSPPSGVSLTNLSGNGATDDDSVIPLPVVTPSGTANTYTVGGVPVAVDSGITVSSFDTDLTGATVTISSGTLQSGDTLNFTNQNGISGSYSGGMLTLSGSATPAQYQTALQSVTFSTTSDSPVTRSLTIVALDNSATSNSAAESVKVIAPPVVTASGTTNTFTLGGTAVAIDSGLTVSSNDTDLTGATVTISSGTLQIGDTLNFTTQNGITGSYSGRVLTLSGSATPAQYQTALRSVAFSTTSTNTAIRAISVVALDNSLTSNSAAESIKVAIVPPVVTASGTVNTFTVGGAAVAVDAGITVSSFDTDLTGAAVTISSGTLQTGDALNFTNQNGITGVYSNGTLTLSGSATPAQYQTALQSVTFSTTSESPVTRSLTIVALDNSLSSNSAAESVKVIAAPIVTPSGVTSTFTIGGAPVAVDSDVTVNSNAPDLTGATVTISLGPPGDALNFTNQNGITGVYSNGVLTLSGSATPAQYQTALQSVTFSTTSTNTTARSISIVAVDNSLTSAPAAETVDVATPFTLSGPSVSNSSTTESEQTTSGLVIKQGTNDSSAAYFQITGITGGTLYQNNGATPITNGSFITLAQGEAGLKFTPTTGSLAGGSFNVQESTTSAVSGLGGATATATIKVTLAGPSVTNAATTANTQTTTGLVITPGPNDNSAAYFQITYITGGTLYLNNGTTQITSGTFITLAQGEAGLKFTPTSAALVAGGFTIREATTGATNALSGATARAAISVTLAGPSVSGATTTENVQTTSGLVIKPGTNDSFAAYFQITGITGGTLYQNNGTTPITNGSFITRAQGEAGLKFTPTIGSLAVSGFLVQESTTGAATGLSGPMVWTPIAVTLSEPKVTGSMTTENTQTTSGLVISPGANDSTAAYFQITYITGGTLYQNNGTTPIANGSFITLAQGEAGLKFTPNAGSLVAGGFTVRESTTNTVAGLSGPTARAAIAVILSGPNVTNSTTIENRQTTSGLVIKPGAGDSTAAYFQITYITGGTLYQNNGTTPIANGSFITLAQGEAGLKFTPNAGSLIAGGFTVRESTTAAIAGLIGPTARAAIAVIRSEPAVTGATTTENVQTTSGLIILPGNSGAQFFQVTAITGGTLYQNDGITPITNGTIITLAQGAAGLKFTPTTGSLAGGSFLVQGSATNAANGLTGSLVGVLITVTLSEPTVTGGTTTENTQTTSGLVVTPGADDTSAAFFQITFITGGTLYQNNGTTPITDGSFITLAQAAAGLKFTPNAGSLEAGGFTVRQSTTNATSGLSGPTARAAITVT